MFPVKKLGHPNHSSVTVDYKHVDGILVCSRTSKRVDNIPSAIVEI